LALAVAIRNTCAFSVANVVFHELRVKNSDGHITNHKCVKHLTIGSTVLKSL